MRYILGSDSLTAFVGGRPYTVNKSAEIFEIALNAVREDDPEAFLSVVDTKAKMATAMQKVEGVTVKGKQIFYGTREITGLLASRFFEMLQLKLDTAPMGRFIVNLMQNPSKRAVDETFDFVSACNLPITEEGNILAYRRVRGDYLDNHSRSVPNKPACEFNDKELNSMPIICGKKGEVTVDIDEETGFTKVSMDRNLVDEDKDRTCSYGLHFCSFEYLKWFSGEKIIVVEINPKDIVAIPSDYNNAKGRTCSYLIVDEMEVSALNNLPVEPISAKTVQKVKEKKADYSKKMNKELADDLRYDYDVNCWDIEDLAEGYGISIRQVKRILNNEAWV